MKITRIVHDHRAELEKTLARLESERAETIRELDFIKNLGLPEGDDDGRPDNAGDETIVGESKGARASKPLLEMVVGHLVDGGKTVSELMALLAQAGRKVTKASLTSVLYKAANKQNGQVSHDTNGRWHLK